MHPLTATTAMEDDDAQALADAVNQINSMFTAAYDWQGRKESPTGERFRDTMEGPYEDAAMAIEQLVVWFSFCAKYSPGASIYWQISPEISHFPGRYGGYRIYCRYLISDKPKRD